MLLLDHQVNLQKKCFQSRRQKKTGFSTFAPLAAQYSFWSHYHNKDTKYLNGNQGRDKPYVLDTVPSMPKRYRLSLTSTQDTVHRSIMSSLTILFFIVKSRVTNIIPQTWDHLFTHNRINVLEGEPEIQDSIHLAPEWNSVQLPSQTMSSTDSTQQPFTRPEGDQLSADDIIDSEGAPEGSTDSHSSERAPEDSDNDPVITHSEGEPVSELQPSSHMRATALTTENSVTTPSQPNRSHRNEPRPGWNADHGHRTRFKTRLQANFTQSAVQPVITSFTPCMDQFTAMLANIEQTRQLDDDTFNFTYPCALQFFFTLWSNAKSR